MSLYLDLSEFLAVPMKTGIQRIGGEICRCSPPNKATAVRLYGDRLIALPQALVGAIGRFFQGQAGTEEIARLSAVQQGSPVSPSDGDTILVPEIFGEQRAAFFRGLAPRQLQRCRFIVYDLLPLTHPQFFPPTTPNELAGYFQVVRQASHCGFISEQTREAYYQRLKRTPDRGGLVLPLGSDALGTRAERLVNRPLTFSVLGTIEPRKNHELILDAFEPLLREFKGLSLWFIGKMGWVDSGLMQRIHILASTPDSGFRFFPTPGDGEIRRCIEQSRATIYVSTAEGYGLPPVESLWVGTPVIASTTIPSLTALGSAGIRYVDQLNADHLREAVLAFMDDRYASSKAEETLRLNLPTWNSFADEVFRWCSQE